MASLSELGLKVLLIDIEAAPANVRQPVGSKSSKAKKNRSTKQN